MRERESERGEGEELKARRKLESREIPCAFFYLASRRVHGSEARVDVGGHLVTSPVTREGRKGGRAEEIPRAPCFSAIHRPFRSHRAAHYRY